MPGTTHHLEFRWTTSRGRDTYGYNICALYVDGVKVSSCNGGGYDMEGTALGNWIARRFAAELRAIPESAMPERSHWEASQTPRQLCADPVCCTRQVVAGIEAGHGDGGLLPHGTDKCPVCGGEVRSAWNEGKRVNDGRSFYGLRFVDPTYNPGNAKLERADGTFTKAEDEGKTLGELHASGKIVSLEILRAAYRETSPFATERHTRPSIDGACGKRCVEDILTACGYALTYVPVRGKSRTVYTMGPVQLAAAASE